eukprot:CAMPEP_0119479952 /NCGR_PEP_ID=MMETSP1344-20130328/8989_1 /TAXON_ID=236787 /ORGANISM="Florenciella parvula, Strain CCMP2471" /LENGTH=78 /DNA_ID=CAMNT_0007514231 /DNA_START=43 /DNA_END=276 /DNA_ORIENTATION=-
MAGLGSPGDEHETPFACEDDWVGVAWRPEVKNPPKSLREENNELKNQKAKLEHEVQVLKAGDKAAAANKEEKSGGGGG